MKGIRKSIVVEAPRGDVFDLVDDPARYREFFAGITKWEPRSKRLRGVGARYRVLMQVGSIEAGGTVRVTARRVNRSIEWTWEQGIHQSGRWSLREGPGGTELTLDVRYDLSGGLLGRLVEHVTGRIVERNLWATLLAARRLLEAEGAQEESGRRSRTKT
ncbi:MAG: SRPBCC family protein [Actinomycetota bacterium]|nr:SRPBCC family protein [Actinomycetota bacterium]